MGTEEQRARRQAYQQRFQDVWNAAIHGQWSNDQQLSDYLKSIGANPKGPIYNQLYSGGGYSVYGPSWDPGWNFDFNAGQKIPWMGQGETWYDPSVASNWQNTDPLQAARMRGFYNWRNQTPVGSQFGGNGTGESNYIAAWLQGRAASKQPNSPDMSWTGTDWSRAAVNPFAATGSGEAPAPPGPMGQSSQAAAPGLTSSDPLAQSQDNLRRKYGTTLAGLAGSY